MGRDGRWLSAGGDPGWPDLVIAGPHGLLIRELKTAHGIWSPAQQKWIGLLRTPTAVDVDVDVWRPADLTSGRIHREIAAISGRPVTT